MELSSFPIRIVIIGAGRGGKALLELFARDQGVQVMGIVDVDPEAPGLRLAQRLGIPTGADVQALLADTHPDIIVNVTNDPSMEALLLKHRPAGAEILGATTARLMGRLAQHERELRDHLIQSEKMATIGTLVSGISHEINNPLFIMMGFSEHLRDERQPEVIRDYVDIILQAGRRIATIVRDLSTFAHRPSPESLCEVNVNQTLTESVKMAGRATVQDDLTVITKFGEVPSVRGKPEEVLQIFLNLVTNAVHAMDGRGTLTLTTHSSDGYVHATIQDTGHGIPHNHLPRIFDPFFTTKEPGKGPGLGLHIVRDIVKMYGGEVSVESTLGHGATFTVKLPAC